MGGNMSRKLINQTWYVVVAVHAALSWTQTAGAIDVSATVKALRIRNSVTGGGLPVSDPLFTQMVDMIAAGNVFGAAMAATNTKYFANYLARRLALQMQTPALDASGITDSDATAFLIAHFVGAGTTPRISTLWSENATYLVLSPTGRGLVHAASLSATDLTNTDWTQMSRLGGQQDNTAAYIPVQHVGGYMTVSDRGNDNSFISFGATAGTNLRMIAGLWQISTGLSLLDVASTSATTHQTPRFVPVYDPNFFHGQGQPACLACHGGGMVSIDHGYAAVANVFDFTGNGLRFVASPATNAKKSLGSDSGQRNRNLTCNLSRNPTPVCNPDSPDVDPGYGWDVSKVWSQTGVLKTMGWQGPTDGHGLQELGYAVGKSWIVYQFLTQRIIAEVCPLGTFSTNEINTIAASANAWADPPGSDDVRTIVARVASSPGCL